MGRGAAARVLLRAAVVVIAVAAAGAAATIPDDWTEGVARHDVLVSAAASDPLPASLQPVLSNGLLGWRVDAPHIVLAGVYSGEGRATPSHRARIPATLALAVEGPPDVEDTCLGAAWDVRGAVYARRRELRMGAAGDDNSVVTVEQRWYAHHAFRGLLAMELRVACSAGFSPPADGLALTLRDAAADPGGDDDGHDLSWTDLSAEYAGLRVLRGKVLLPEDPSNTTIPAPEVVLVSTAVPPTVRVTGNQSWHFLAALRTAPLGVGPQEPASYGDPLQGALQDHRVATLMAPSGELEALHRDRWKDIWAGAGIELEMAAPSPTQLSAASVPLPSAVNASLLALLSAGREDWPYGVAAGGLTEGGGGHVRWDTEIYLLPTLLLLDPGRAQTMLQYRLERLAAAEAKARGATPRMAGAMFPWESAFTGMETAAMVEGEGAVDYAERAVHVSGAVAWAAWQCYLATQDRQWLASVGFPLLQGVARFWATRAQLDAAGAAHIHRVVPPDGAAGVVDDSVYTNGVAALSLCHAARAARLLGPAAVDADVEEVGRWEALAAALVLPVDEAALGAAHPEYAGYAGQALRQADVVLLGFPLGLYDYLDALRPQEAEAQRRARGRDVAYYGKRYDPVGGVGALTWGMHAVNLLDFGEMQAAADAFDTVLAGNCHGPFAVWTERAPGEAGGIAAGMTNFLPAAGGFLQALLFGYAGLRILESDQEEEKGEAGARLRVFPRCLPGVKSVRLRHVAFLGSHLGLNYTCSCSTASMGTMTVGLSRSPPAGPHLTLLLSSGENREHARRLPLVPGSAVTVPAQEAFIVGVVDDELDGSPSSSVGVVAVSARAGEGGGGKECKHV